MDVRRAFRKLISEFKTTDIYSIINGLNINVIVSDLGSTSGICTSITFGKDTLYTIHINSNLDEQEAFFTLAHELGHYILHPEENINQLRRFSLAPLSKTEFQANLFASYFVISDEEFIEINNIYIVAENYKLPLDVCEERANLIKEEYKY